MCVRQENKKGHRSKAQACEEISKAMSFSRPRPSGEPAWARHWGGTSGPCCSPRPVLRMVAFFLYSHW